MFRNYLCSGYQKCNKHKTWAFCSGFWTIMRSRVMNSSIVLWLVMKPGWLMPTVIQKVIYAVAAYWSPIIKKIQNAEVSEKIMATFFWDRKWILLILLTPGQSINAERDCETLRKLQNKKGEQLTNTLPHTVNLLNSCGWDILNHPVHSPNLASSDFSPFWKSRWVENAFELTKKRGMPCVNDQSRWWQGCVL